MAKSKKPPVADSTDKEVKISRRKEAERRTKDRRSGTIAAVHPGPERRQTEERRKVQRRRQIDPTTCERDYSLDEIEFMQALDAYKRAAGRMFPTCSEILEVIRGLGYTKPRAAEETLISEPLALNSEN